MTDQAQRLRELLEKKKSIKEAKTIAVMSGKGGVGKSNFALNFAIGLSNQNKRVLIFDLDFGMGNIDVLLGLAPKKTIIDLFTGTTTLYETIEEGPGSISYVGAGSGLTEIFEINQDQFDLFLTQLREVAYQYDYIIFDLGAGIQRQHLLFALAAHETVIVTTTEPTSITDAYAVVKHLYAYQPNLSLHLLINRAINERDGKETIDRLTKVVRRFLHKEMKTLGVLFDDRAVTEAVKAQIPFLLKNEKSIVSRNMQFIVESYLKVRSNNENTNSHSFVTKLKMMFLKER